MSFSVCGFSFWTSFWVQPVHKCWGGRVNQWGLGIVIEFEGGLVTEWGRGDVTDC